MNKRDFLTTKFPELLNNLSSDTEANFGLMTPQHMVEHLIGAIEIATEKYEGERKPCYGATIGYAEIY